MAKQLSWLEHSVHTRRVMCSNHIFATKNTLEFSRVFYLTNYIYLCIINIGNDNSTNVVLPGIFKKLTSTLQSTDVSFFYLCICLSTQFLYRTAVKAIFNVKDNIKHIIKISFTLNINITTSPTIFRVIGGKTTSAYYHFLYFIQYHAKYNKIRTFFRFYKMFIMSHYKYGQPDCNLRFAFGLAIDIQISTLKLLSPLTVPSGLSS